MSARQQPDRDFTTIRRDELIFHPHSFADDAGRLFKWNGELFRGLSYAHSAFFVQLFRDQTIQALVERGLLIETHLTDVCVDGYGVVVSHRSVPFISYPNEWCAAMLRDAAVVIIDLAIELARRGLALKDAHPWNVLFDSTTPVFVDLTSISPQNDGPDWAAYDEFCRFCYYPLILMAYGQERMARSLLPEYQGVLRAELMAVLRGSGPSSFIFSKILRRGLRSIQGMVRKNSGHSTLAFLEQTRNDLEQIKLPSYDSRNQHRRAKTITEPSTATWEAVRPRTLRRILTELGPKTVLDLSRGILWTSTLPAAMGFNVVSLDADAARVTSLYKIAHQKNLPILPLIVDFIKPTPSVGYSDHYSIAAVERLKCDMVLALGLADDILSNNHFNFALIAEGLSLFSKRWLLVEFDDSKGGDHECDLKLFTEALLKHFRSVTVVSSETRINLMLLCEK